MQHKKTQIMSKHDGRSSRMSVKGVRFGERSDPKNLRVDFRSIVSAAHKLPAEVAPPARVWSSLRAQLEEEGILTRAMKSRLEEHTRFPMFRN